MPEGDPHWSGLNPDPGTSKAPFKLYNIGNNSPVKLMDFINALEEVLGKTAEKKMLPMQPGDVPATWADVKDLVEDLGYNRPGTPVKEGIKLFVNWYREFYKV